VIEVPFKKAGFAGLMGNRGKMHLILGAHDVPRELLEAHRMDVGSGQEVVEEIARFPRAD